MARDKKEDQKEELALVGEVPATKLKAPKGASSVCVGGETYEVEDGHVVVPSTEADALRDHGYTDAE